MIFRTHAQTSLPFFMNIQKQKKTFFFSFLIGSCFLYLFSSSSFAANTLLIKASDTIAGYSTTIRLENAVPGESLILSVVDPIGSLLEIPITADASGYSATELLGFHTRRSGKYKISASGNKNGYSASAHFFVYTENVSSTESSFSAHSSIVPSGEKGTLRINLRDRYGNSIPGRSVKVISSRSGDEIIPIKEEKTNSNGEISFFVASRNEGISTFTALDEYSGITLDKRVKISFSSFYDAIGGDQDASPSFSSSSWLSANTFGSSIAEAADVYGAVSSFELVFPKKVEVQSDQNYLTVKALDANGELVKNFTGSILLALPDDPNATIPNDGIYTFKSRDQGVFTFPLAIIFSELGQQKIEVYQYDTENEKVYPNINGSLMVNVVENTGLPNPSPSPSSKDSILFETPRDGSRTGTKSIPISGKGTPNTDIKIYLDGTLAKTIGIDSNGIFRDQLFNVGEGDHELYATEAEEGKFSSEKIQFFVDTKAPKVQEVFLFPNEPVEPEAKLNLTVIADQGLSLVKMSVDGEEEFLSENQRRKGTYELTFSAPKTPGSYDISISLENAVGNVTEETKSKMLVVKNVVQELEAPKNLKGTPTEGGVALSWDAVSPTEEDVPIVLYVIHAGMTEMGLSRIESVSGEKTNVVISNIPSGETRLFSVSAINAKGKESPKSQAISVQAGGETTHPVASPPIAAPKIKVMGMENAVTLSWDQYTISPISSYEIFYGIQSGVYTARKSVSGGRTTETINDLIPGVAYFFTIIPRDSLGNLLQDTQYGEAYAIPLGKSTPTIIKEYIQKYPQWIPNVGPALFIITGIAFLFTAYFFLFKGYRKNRYQR